MRADLTSMVLADESNPYQLTTSVAKVLACCIVQARVRRIR